MGTAKSGSAQACTCHYTASLCSGNSDAHVPSKHSPPCLQPDHFLSPLHHQQLEPNCQVAPDKSHWHALAAHHAALRLQHVMPHQRIDLVSHTISSNHWLAHSHCCFVRMALRGMSHEGPYHGRYHCNTSDAQCCSVLLCFICSNSGYCLFKCSGNA